MKFPASPEMKLNVDYMMMFDLGWVTNVPYLKMENEKIKRKRG